MLLATVLAVLLGSVPFAAAAPSATSTGGAPGKTLTGAQRLAADHLPVAVSTRVTSGATKNKNTAPTISVRVGTRTFSRTWKTFAACNGVWLLALDDTTLQPITTPDGTDWSNGVAVPECSGGVSDPLAAITARGHTIVIVNTLRFPDDFGIEPKGLTESLSSLGFTSVGLQNPTAVAPLVASGVGATSMAPGGAWLTFADAGGDSTGVARKSAADLDGYFLIDASSTFRFVSLAAVPYALGTDGSIQVGNPTLGAPAPGGPPTPTPSPVGHKGHKGKCAQHSQHGKCNQHRPKQRHDCRACHHPASSTSTGATTAPGVGAVAAASGGFRIAVYDRSQPFGAPKASFVASTVVSGQADPQAIATLSAELTGLAAFPTALVFVASFGSDPLGAATARQRQPLVTAVAKFGVIPNVITDLKAGEHLSIAAVSPAVLASAPVVSSPEITGAGDGSLSGVLTLAHQNKWFRPSTGSTGTDLGGTQLQSILAQPPSTWPVPAGDDEVKAFTWWGNQLCSCGTQLRRKYVDGEVGSWPTTFATAAYPGLAAGFSQAAFQTVKTALLSEYQAVVNVQKFQQHVNDLYGDITGEKAAELTAAVTRAGTQLKNAAQITVADENPASLKYALLFTRVGGVLPVVGGAFKAGNALITFLADLPQNPNGTEQPISTTVGNLAEQLVRADNNQQTYLGDVFDVIYTDHDKLLAVGQKAASATSGAWFYDANENGVVRAAIADNAEAYFLSVLLGNYYEVLETPNGHSSNVLDWGVESRCQVKGSLRVFNRYTSPLQWTSVPSPDGRWHLVAVGRHKMFPAICTAPIPLTADLLTYLQKPDSAGGLGIYMPQIFWQWGLHRTAVDSDAPAFEHSTCWIEPDDCYLQQHRN